MSKKEKQTVWLYPETKELISKHLDAAAVQNDSQFIEKAVNFYAGHLDCNTMAATDYLGAAVHSIIDGIVLGSEQRISRAIFKLAVESAMHSHILAAMHDVTEEQLGKLCNLCMNEIRKTNGIINFRAAREFQKS